VDDLKLKDVIKHRYGKIARGEQTFCCPTCGPTTTDQCLAVGYTAEDLRLVPEMAILGVGCGNPTALADLKVGETVLDLGSGAGIDVFLAAHKVGEPGRVIGVDMTEDMVARGQQLAREHGFANVEFRQGDIEHLPVADASIDAVISNCVINLSTDKPKVFAEAFRTLRPGGRLAVSDVVFQGDPDLIPAPLRQMVNAWAGCVAGALSESEYIGGLKAAGFTDVSIQVTRHYSDEVFQSLGITPPAGVKLLSGFVRARKPSEA